MRAWFLLNLLFYRLSNDSSPVIWMITLSPERGVVSLDGTWRCLAVLACVVCPGCIYDFVCFPPRGSLPDRSLRRIIINVFNHPPNGIKCGDLLNLFRGPARHDTNGPARHSLDPCLFYFGRWHSRGLLVFSQLFPLQLSFPKIFKFNVFEFN